jgi:hypothetical protein
MTMERQHAPDAGPLVSPITVQMVRGARAQALFNTDEVLARDLVNYDVNNASIAHARSPLYPHAFAKP